MGKPVWGTCAGLIFLADRATGLYFFPNQHSYVYYNLQPCIEIDKAWCNLSGQKIGGQELIGGLDCTVHRNFFGSQVHIFLVGAFNFLKAKFNFLNVRFTDLCYYFTLVEFSIWSI